MPADRVVETIYLKTGAPQTENNDTLYKPGELGARMIDNDEREWQLVKIDSGVTAATPIGTISPGQLAYWKVGTLGQFIVTNDRRFAEGFGGGHDEDRNYVAGSFQNVTGDATSGYNAVTLTPGNYTCIQTHGRSFYYGVNIKGADAASVIPGCWLVADNTAGGSQCTVVTAGTAPGVRVVGIGSGTAVQGTWAPCVFQIPKAEYF